MNPSSFLASMRRFAPLLLVFASMAVAITAYMQTLDYPFIDDDGSYLIENTKLAGLHLTNLWRIFTEPYNPFEFLPLRDISYWFDITLFGLNPSAFRLHNMLLYLLSLPLVYATTLKLWRYFRPANTASAPWAAAIVTVLFTVHPAHVEAVVWATGRKDVLSGMFSILALWFAVNAKREQGFSAPHAVAAMVAFVAVMLSKASYVAVAPIIALLWFAFWRDIPAPNRRRFLLLWPLSILSLAAFLTLIFTANSTVKGPVYFGIEAATRSLAVLGRLANIAITPESRHFYYPVIEYPYFSGMLALGTVVLVAAAAGGVMSLRKWSLEGFALIAFLLLCIPYMQLVPFRTYALVQDRYVALAVWPVTLLFVALSWRFNPVPRTILLLFIALPWSLQTIERPRDWRSLEAILDADLRTYPEYYVPVVYKILHIQILQGLDRDAIMAASSITDHEIKNITIGIIKADVARANAINTGNPDNAMALLSELGHVLKQPPAQTMWDTHKFYVWKNLTDALSDQCDDLAKHFPDSALVRYNVGLCMLDIQHDKDAITHLRVATMSQHLPESMRGTAFYSLGLAFINTGYAAIAEVPLHAALEQSPPDLRAYCLLSKVYRQNGLAEEAARAEAECRNRI